MQSIHTIELSFNLKEEGHSDIYYSMNEPRGHYAE